MWWLLGEAQAQEADPGDVIVVEDHPTVEAARADLDAALRSADFLPGVDLGKKTVYYSVHRWKGRVAVFDAGYIEAHASWVIPQVVRARFSRGRAYVEVDGMWSTPKEAREVEALGLVRYEPLVRRWREAIAAEGLAERIDGIGVQLDAIWTAHPDADGRAQMAAMWRNTTDTEEGQRVRDLVVDYIRAHCGSAPFTPQELEAANREPKGFDAELLP